MRLVILLFLLLGVGAAPTFAQEDILLLKDGRIFDQLNIERTADGILVHYKTADIAVPLVFIEDVLLFGEEHAPFEPTTEEERTRVEEGLIPFEGKWVKPQVRDQAIQKRVATQRALVEEIDAHSVWRNRYQVKTKYFNFEHTIPPFVFDHYRELMEAYFGEFCKEWKVKPQKGYAADLKETRLLVCFYNDRELFHQVSGAGSSVLGYFRYVKPLELDIYYDRLDPQLTAEVMFHEANHYLQKLINVEFSYPHWPGEALAEYYGASQWDPVAKKLHSGLVLEGRLTEVNTDIAKGEWMSLDKMLSTEMYQHYTWGWTFVHFLMNDSRYEKKFRKFYTGLANDKKVSRVAVGVDNLKTVRQEDVKAVLLDYLDVDTEEEFLQLESDWHAYVREELKVTSTHGLEKAAENANRYNRPIRAKRLYEEAIAAGGASALAYHRFAELLANGSLPSKDSEENWIAAQKHWATAIEMSPMTGEYYFALGMALRDHGQRDEGMRLMQIAAEIDPSNRQTRQSLEDVISIDD
jgi:tetratricopeptide (TPR) repeat protein